jgi:hypothetical protein
MQLAVSNFVSMNWADPRGLPRNPVDNSVARNR